MPDTDIINKPVAIVTGAGQGIGLAICQELAQCGMAIVLNDLQASLTQTAVERITEKFGEVCIGVPGDASDVLFIQELVQKAVAHYGKVTIAVANAGITTFGDFLTYTPAALQNVMDLNLRGSFFLAQAVVQQIIKQNSGGSILFMSSVTGHQAHKNLAAYGMTKAALEMLAKSLVVEVSEYNISVNAIAPGATLTERTSEDADYEKTWSGITPMGRPATPADIAYAAAFLVSERARHITGQTIIIDGGWSSTSPSPYK